MDVRRVLFFLLCILPLQLKAQDRQLMTIEQEPHHRHLFKNDVVDVLMEEIPPGETPLLHFLTKNEEQDLPGCLASVSWSDDGYVR